MTDPRISVLLCLLANLVVVVPTWPLCIAMKVVVVVWYVAFAYRRKRLLLAALGLDAVIALCLGMLMVWADAAALGAFMSYLRWTVVALAGLLLLGPVGGEEFLRVLFWARLPRLLVIPVGFALRSIPVVQEEMQQYRRTAAALRSLQERRLGIVRRFHLLETVVVRSIMRFDHMMSQLERRGFTPTVFGSPPLFAFSARTIAGLASCAVLLGLGIWGLLLRLSA